MNNSRIFKNLNLEKISNELYSPLSVGGMIIPEAIHEEVTNSIIREIESGSFFQEAPYDYGIAQQRMDVFYIGEADKDHKVEKNFPCIDSLTKDYISFYEELGKMAKFIPSTVNSIGIHRYKPKEGKITLHRDSNKYANLISIMNLKGRAEFYLSAQLEKLGLTLETTPNSLILIRAPRSPQEKNLRPYHGVGNVLEERYSLILRSRLFHHSQ